MLFPEPKMLVTKYLDREFPQQRHIQGPCASDIGKHSD